MIHPSAIIDKTANIAADVEIGPWTVIGKNVEISAHTKIGSHVIIHKWTRIGEHNHIHAFSCLGSDPQDRSYQQEETWLEIGEHNIIREYCSIHRGSVGGGTTKIGNQNFIMSYVHIAHDCRIGDNTTFVNNASLAGHVSVDDFAYIGSFTGVHQFCRIGTHSFISAAMIKKDVPPYILVYGTPTRVVGINRIGLERHGFSIDTIQKLRRAYRIMYRQNLSLSQVIEQFEALGNLDSCYEIQCLVHFLAESVRGIVR